ncbi:biosynthetic-type acetolactate synthase large subunit [Amphibacillus sp. MSJ-3]|uniref:biosynthetic-type acetolactate synthase large subunit n=1 Tax=Amphibacillus sp. MSJ-3 TaxID=2841505 RepID=UPI001C0F1A26|nr:biosynthetic-type acetolactate synthase large subunit [Amphibacillus sp. MSJ-3]MBU5593767.1 biosynthetic-type acetolactate synthase large subunit [Amphibacillus sp. MSJ-3]
MIQFEEQKLGEQKLIDIFEQHKVEFLFKTATNQSFFCNTDHHFTVEFIHDQAAIHAADGYSRTTGKIGVGWLTSESGVTNAVTSLGTAQLDSVPLVIFIEHQRNSIDQQLDVDGLTKSMTKYNFTANSINELIPMTKAAFKIAQTGRPGIVVIDFNRQILRQTYEGDQQIHIDQLNQEFTQKEIPRHIIEQLPALIAQAKQPVIIVGGGCVISNAHHALANFLAKTQIPFVSTLMGLGAVNADHPLHLGMIGMHGTFAANRAVHQADLLICLGVRFSDRITGNIKGFSPNSLKVQIDIDPVEINKLIDVEYPIVGDVNAALTQLNHLNLKRTNSDWLKTVMSWHKKSAQFHKAKNKLIDPGAIIRLLNKYANNDAIVSTDVGQHQMWTAHHFSFQKPRSFLTSGGFGTMGYGLPAAIGGAMAKPNQQVICISGDGSFQMNLQELLTAVRYQLNIKIAIFKNGYLGMVRQWQQLFYERHYSQVQISSPDFVKLAESYGVIGLAAETIDQANEIIKKAMEVKGPVLMTFTIEDELNVFPIVPPGGNNTDALQ